MWKHRGFWNISYFYSDFSVVFVSATNLPSTRVHSSATVLRTSFTTEGVWRLGWRGRLRSDLHLKFSVGFVRTWNPLNSLTLSLTCLRTSFNPVVLRRLGGLLKPIWPPFKTQSCYLQIQISLMFCSRTTRLWTICTRGGAWRLGCGAGGVKGWPCCVDH